MEDCRPTNTPDSPIALGSENQCWSPGTIAQSWKCFSILQAIRDPTLPWLYQVCRFSNHYSGSVPDFEDFFTDDTMTDLRNDVVDQIQAKIIDELIIPVASSQTVDKTIIAPLVKADLFKVSHGITSTRLTKNSLRDTMRSIIATNTVPAIVNLTISLAHLYFPPSFTYLDFGVFTTSPPAANPVTAAATGPPVLTIADVTSAIAAQTNALTAAITGIAQLRAPLSFGSAATSAATTITTQVQFNPAALPADVRYAYNAHQANEVILGSSVAVPFAGGFRHLLDGAGRLFFATACCS